MLGPDQLKEFLKDLESDRVERTTSTNDTDKFAQAVCAFANDLPNHKAPGFLIVGANNDGKPSGLTVTDQLLQNLAALRSDGNIQPYYYWAADFRAGGATSFAVSGEHSYAAVGTFTINVTAVNDAPRLPDSGT